MGNGASIPSSLSRKAQALVATRRFIEQETDIPGAERRDILDTWDQATSVVNSLRGLAQAFMRGMSHTDGGPFG